MPNGEMEFNFDPDDYTYQLRSTSTHSPLTEAEKKLKNELMERLNNVLDEWNRSHQSSSYDPIPHVKKIAEIIEEATNEFMKRDPDPLDDRHPHRTHPESAFGNLLKVLFRNDDFMNKLVISYILGRENVELNIQGCRLLLGCVPGLDSMVVFSEPDDFIPRLYSWAKDSSNETLQAYSMGLLSAALEVTENASKYRSENAVLVPIALKRLKELKEKMEEENRQTASTSSKEFQPTDFSHLVKDGESSNSNDGVMSEEKKDNVTSFSNGEKKSTRSGDVSEEPPKKRRKTKQTSNYLKQSTTRIPSYSSLQNLDNSNSKWDILQPFLIGTHQVYPLTIKTYQRLILQYLGPTGEYQDLLGMTYEGNAMNLIMDYIDLDRTQDIRLTFDALKYLTSLLVHRKFAMEFVARGGVESILKIPRTSLASVGVVTSLYYLSYNSDVMERVCQLGETIVDDIVEYALWCLEHSHESGMASASMFFTQALYFKMVLTRFDQYDGPRKLYNYISTLSILQDVAAKDDFELSEEQMHTSTQCVRNACQSFRAYVMVHMFLKIESFRKAITPKHMFWNLINGCSLILDIPNDKTMRVNEEHAVECQKVLSILLRFSGSSWRAIEELRRLGVIKTMLGVKMLSGEWNSTTGRAEISLNVLNVIAICCCLPKVQLELIENQTHVHMNNDGITVILEAAQGRQPEGEGENQIAALNVLITCICVPPEFYKRLSYIPPKSRTSDGADKKDGRKSSRGNSSQSTALAHLETMWSAMRKCDAIMILIELVNAVTPLTNADNIRTLACTALSGFALSRPVKQILSKVPLIANNELQGLMRKPVVQDKRTEHTQFCREAMKLLEIVTGKRMRDQHAKDLTQEKMHKQWIVENTKINYNEKELLQLIHEHLQKKGLSATADLLKNEADLPDVPASRAAATPAKLKPLPKLGNSMTSISSPVSSLTPRAGRESEIGVISARRASSNTNSSLKSGSQESVRDDNLFATPTFVRNKSVIGRSSAAFPRKFHISPMKSKLTSANLEATMGTKPHRALDDILTEYFRQQHSHCTNPVATCPPFSLFYTHRCPETSTIGRMPSNIVDRFLIRDVLQPHSRTISQLYDERYVFSRFRPARVIHEHDETYTTSSFAIDDEHIIIGLFSGEVHWMNIESGADESVTNCHNSAITHIEPSADGAMLLTSSAFVRPLSALWRLGETQELLRVFNDEFFVKFSNLNLDRIIGTNSGKATVYDTETNHALNIFQSPDFDQLRYSKNMASFSPCDKLIFNNGMLWDVRAPQQYLHLFDKLNASTLAGVFHPHGNQVIINTEVFDIRTYNVLQYVPALDQCRVSFNSSGNIMFASMFEEVDEENFQDSINTSSFRTFDTSDYSVITTVDMKRPLIHLCSSHNDQMMAVVEQMKSIHHEYAIQSASQVRILEIGKQKDVEDDADEGEEEEEENDDDDDDRSDSEDSIAIDDDDSLYDMRMRSDEERGVFELLGVRESSADDFSESEDYSESEASSASSSSSSSSGENGWVTASSEESNNEDDENGEGGENGENGEGGGNNDDAGNEDNQNNDEDDQDSSYEPEFSNDYNSTSSTTLNPTMRRRNNS